MSSLSNQSPAFDRALAALGKVPRPILAVFVAFALGLGVNTAIFTLGYSQRSGLYPRPDELVVLRSHMAPRDFIHLRTQTTVFQDLNASTEGAFRITTQDGPKNAAA